MRRNKQQFQRPGRAGVTWFDVIASILILLLLFTLASMYTVKNAVPASRRAECQNHLKQIVTAACNRASRHNGRLPFLTAKYETVQTNWFIELLPGLDHAPLHRDWHSSDQAERERLREKVLRVAQCPDDKNKYGKNADLSYVANSGYGYFPVAVDSFAVMEPGPHSPVTIDWNGDGEITDIEKMAGFATGVFWHEGSTGGRDSSLGYISNGDGQSNTIMFAENRNAGAWSSSKTMDIAFVAGLERIEFAGEREEANILALKKADLGPFALDGGRASRHSPGPGSNHGGVVFFAMADGGARQISSQIDQLVYLRLMTPNGHRFGQTVEGLDRY